MASFFSGGGRGLLGLGDDLLDEGTQGPGLRQRGLDAAMADERGRQIGEQGRAMLAGDAEGLVMFEVTHCGY